MTELEPVDVFRCQTDVPGNGPFTMGGVIGDPKNGYRVRCENQAAFIAIEKTPGADGRTGAMSVCDKCQPVLLEQCGENFAHLVPIKTLKDPRGAALGEYEDMLDLLGIKGRADILAKVLELTSDEHEKTKNTLAASRLAYKNLLEVLCLVLQDAELRQAYEAAWRTGGEEGVKMLAVNICDPQP
jgi:hypothetical protein